MQNEEEKGIKTIIEGNDFSSLNDKLIMDTIINCSEDTIYFKDMKSRFLFINQAQATRLGLSNPSMGIGKTDFDFFPKEQAQKAYDDEQKIMKNHIPLLSRVELLHWPGGGYSWVSVSKYPLYNAEGKLIGTWGTSRDVTAQKNAEEELGRLNIQLNELNKNLEQLSLTDPLSGLYNRRYFNEIMCRTFNEYEQKIKEGIHTDFSICVSDIDLFKSVNDSFGHLVGDNIIKHVGDILKSMIRDTDIAFRYGGDEFVILFYGVDKSGAVKIAERLGKIVRETPIICSGGKINITLSMGISSVDEADNLNDLLDIADKRLYLSKRNGRNRITL